MPSAYYAKDNHCAAATAEKESGGFPDVFNSSDIFLLSLHPIFNMFKTPWNTYTVRTLVRENTPLIRISTALVRVRFGVRVKVRTTYVYCTYSVRTLGYG